MVCTRPGPEAKIKYTLLQDVSYPGYYIARASHHGKSTDLDS